MPQFKRLALLFVGWLLALPTGYAQVKWVARLNSGFHNYRFLDHQTLFGIGPNRAFTVNTELEALAQKTIHKHLRISGGMSYLRNPYRYNNVAIQGFIDPFSSSINFDKVGDILSTDHSIGLPIYLHGYLGAKNRFIIGGGLIQNILLFQRNVITSKEANVKSKQVNLTRPIYPYYTGAFELGYNLKLANHNELMMTFRASTNLSLMFNKLAGNTIEYTMGLSVGYNFNSALTQINASQSD